MARRQKLGAKWQLGAALLSRPVDLTTLVTMSLSDPKEFFRDDTLHRMVKLLLNEGNERKSNHNTKLDVGSFCEFGSVELTHMAMSV